MSKSDVQAHLQIMGKNDAKRPQLKEFPLHLLLHNVDNRPSEYFLVIVIRADSMDLAFYYNLITSQRPKRAVHFADDRMIDTT